MRSPDVSERIICIISEKISETISELITTKIQECVETNIKPLTESTEKQQATIASQNERIWKSMIQIRELNSKLNQKQ